MIFWAASFDWFDASAETNAITISLCWNINFVSLTRKPCWREISGSFFPSCLWASNLSAYTNTWMNFHVFTEIYQMSKTPTAELVRQQRYVLFWNPILTYSFWLYFNDLENPFFLIKSNIFNKNILSKNYSIDHWVDLDGALSRKSDKISERLLFFIKPLKSTKMLKKRLQFSIG